MTQNTNSPLSKLQGFFGKKDDQPAIGAMTADKYRQLLERGLSESPTGNALLRFASAQRIGINVITAKGASGYIPENRAVYIALPSGLSTVLPEDILSLGIYLRQAELQLLGIKNPDLSIGSLENAIAFDKKILDGLTVMCKIVSEIGKSDFIDALARMGHSEFYKGFVEYGPGQKLTDLYYKVYIEAETQ